MKTNWEHVYTVLLAITGNEKEAREALLYLMCIEDEIEERDVA